MKASRIISYTVGAVVGCCALFVVYYLVFSHIFSTDLEKRLEEENARYRDALPSLEQNVALLDEEIAWLKSRDEVIYKKIFKSGTPSSFSCPSRGGLPEMMESAARTEDNWREIYALVNGPQFTVPPVHSPIEGLDYTSIGASVGEKINPFYKMPFQHDGVDLVAPALTPVHAAASGTVTAVKNITGGKGTVVEITHRNGYVTRYAHLQKSLVKARKKVAAGDVIGLVGDSGRSFSTHLHYELEKDGQILDPVYWFFDSQDPQFYYNMLVISTISRQSMD